MVKFLSVKSTSLILEAFVSLFLDRELQENMLLAAVVKGLDGNLSLRMLQRMPTAHMLQTEEECVSSHP